MLNKQHVFMCLLLAWPHRLLPLWVQISCHPERAWESDTLRTTVGISTLWLYCYTHCVCTQNPTEACIPWVFLSIL